MAYLPTCLPAYLPAYLPTYLPTCLPTCLPTYLPSYLPTCLPTYLPTCLPSPTLVSPNGCALHPAAPLGTPRAQNFGAPNLLRMNAASGAAAAAHQLHRLVEDCRGMLGLAFPPERLSELSLPQWEQLDGLMRQVRVGRRRSGGGIRGWGVSAVLVVV